MRYKRLFAILALLLIAFPSINSLLSSLQQEFVISTQGTILVQDNGEGGKVIWKWDGTMQDILSRDRDRIGYLHNEDRMKIMTMAGKHCVRFHEPDITPKGGFDSVAITLYVKEQYQPEYWAKISVFVPTSFDLNGEWWNIMSINQEYGGGEYLSDPLRFHGNGGLRSIMVGPEPEEHYYKSDYYMPKGKWVTIKVHVIKHKTNGVYKIWFDNELVHDLHGLYTEWPISDESRIRIAAGYAGGGVKRPFDIYFSDFVLGWGTP